MRSKRRVLWRVGIGLAAAVVALAAFFAFRFGLTAVRDWVGGIFSRWFAARVVLFPEEKNKTATLPADLVSFSFNDLLSSYQWFDAARTTLFHDFRETALLFPPLFEWKPYEGVPPSDIGFFERAPDGSVTYCLRSSVLGALKKCLTVRDGKLSMSGSSVALPKELAGKEMTSLSVGALETQWLVGAVIRSGSEYRGVVYSFDGTAFKNLLDEATTPLRSGYEGTIGFGGSDRDWIAIYGGYEGKAVRMKGAMAEDLSRYFSFRVMDSGFEPAVTRAGNGWYVGSMTRGAPRFIKLFENAEGKVSGALDFTPLLLNGIQGGADELSFVLLGEDPPLFLARARVNGGNETFWRFTDLGFQNDKAASAVSGEVHQASNYAVATAKLFPRGETDGVRFFLSNDDGAQWVPADPGKTVIFSNARPSLKWKAEFLPRKNRYESPSVESMYLNYGAVRYP